MFFNKNTSMFSKSMHASINNLLGAIVTPLVTYRLKRINVIYQSNDDPEDIMIKTIPGDSDFTINDN